MILKALEAREVVTHSLEWQRWGARAVKGKMVKGEYASARHATPSLSASMSSKIKMSPSFVI